MVCHFTLRVPKEDIQRALQRASVAQLDALIRDHSQRLTLLQGAIEALQLPTLRSFDALCAAQKMRVVPTRDALLLVWPQSPWLQISP